MARIYVNSGRVNWLRLALVLPCAVVAAAALGALYQWVLTAPAVRVPILIMIPVGLAAVVGVVALADFAGRLAHTRHISLGSLCGLAIALACVAGAHWYDHAHAVPKGATPPAAPASPPAAAAPAAAPASSGQTLAQRKVTGVGFVRDKAGGVTFGLTGGWVYLWWVAEAGLFVLGGLMGGTAGASRPYCESCRGWVSRPRWSFVLKDVADGSVAELKGAAELEPLLAVRSLRAETDKSLRCRVRSCGCDGTADLRVQLRTTKKKADGSTSHTDEVLFEELLLDSRGLDRLYTWAERLDPSMAEKRPRLDIKPAEPFTLTVESCLDPTGQHVSLTRWSGRALASDASADNEYTRAVRRRLALGEWETAETALRAQRRAEDLAYVAEACADWEGQPPWMAAWEREKPDSAAMALVRGISHVKWAWQARGGDWTPKDYGAFQARLTIAEEYLHRATELSPRDPTPWAWLIYTAKGLMHEPEEARRRFDKANRRAPGHRPAHSFLLDYLAPKWHGSKEEMLEFARRTAAGSPPGSHAPVILAEAHIELAFAAKRDAGKGRGKEAMAEYWSNPAVGVELRQACTRALNAPGYKPTMDTPRTRSYFAYALWKSGQLDAAAELLRIIGPKSPWGPFDPPIPGFKDKLSVARKACGVR